MAKRRCQGKTKAGGRCEHRGATYCAQHADQAPARKSAVPRTGRTPKKARARKAEDWRPRFLECFAEQVTVSAAAREAGVGRRTAYDERERNEAFAQAWADIEGASTEEMEREAYRRAVEGWVERGIFDDDGERIGEVRKFSDTLIIFLLKARRPDTYREQLRHEHSGPDGGPIAAQITAVASKENTDAAHDFIERIAAGE